MMLLFIVLAIGAACATFIENDFGSIRAKELVYNSFWYEFTFFIASINLIAIIIKTKMYKIKTRALFHASFIVILFGALITHYFGFEGMMHIREGEKSNIIKVNDEEITTPFYIYLKDFTLTRYPGSRAPSEFSSDVTLTDEQNNIKFDAKVYMNNTLSYGGYKFFQTSYDNDEMGTKFSVNNDPGVEITYVGYALLFLGLILNLFDKKSRFQYLVSKIKKISTNSVLLFLVFLVAQPPLEASSSNYSEYIKEYLVEHKTNSKKLAAEFSTLIVQGPMGRMKPLSTQNRDVLNKISGSSSWEGMNQNQVMLGMFVRSDIWKKVNIIKVKTPKLRKLLSVSKKQKLLKFTDFFKKNGEYKLSSEVERANQLVPSKRGTYERDLISVDERLNIFFMSYRGVLLKFFPLQNDPSNRWVDFKTMFELSDNSQIKRSVSRLLDETYNRNYNKALEYVKDIKAYQSEYGKSVMPDTIRVQTEIIFNDLNLFFRLSIIYLTVGFFLFVYSVISMFYNRLVSSKIRNITTIAVSILFLAHTVGLGLRWYIGGFAPVSNTYETMVYISYSSLLAGILFFRRSLIALSASLIVAGIFIFGAYLGEIDPEITNLVPVLKSYWLSIHVSVITASYGFFGVGALLGAISLLLFTAKDKNKTHLDAHIKNISYIIEAALILGLTLLVIGNFLGGIWANESWGRYWGWDPKETWAYISILVYVMVIHLRLLKGIYSTYLFSVLSLVSFSSILMTYYGVNFYLAGMHSYATGDPVPIPGWVYISCLMVAVLALASYPKRKLNEKRKR